MEILTRWLFTLKEHVNKSTYDGLHNTSCVMHSTDSVRVRAHRQRAEETHYLWAAFRHRKGGSQIHRVTDCWWPQSRCLQAAKQYESRCSKWGAPFHSTGDITHYEEMASMVFQDHKIMVNTPRRRTVCEHWTNYWSGHCHRRKTYQGKPATT